MEKVYENAMANRLRKQGLTVAQQYPVPVFDEDGTLLGDFYADLLFDNKLIIEIKSARSLSDAHSAQILGYLRATRMEHGMQINFGGICLQVKKLVLSRTHTTWE